MFMFRNYRQRVKTTGVDDDSGTLLHELCFEEMLM